MGEENSYEDEFDSGTGQDNTLNQINESGS